MTRRLAVPLVSLISAIVILGPALSAGLVEAYDLGWSPDPRWTPTVLGLDAPAPRVLPSDGVGVLLGQIVGASAAQKVVLLAILVLAASGAVRLLQAVSDQRVGLAGSLAAALAAQWNPFVAERLVIGQWTVLLGYALLPWAGAAALARQPRLAALVAPVAAASLGGANSAVVVLLGVAPLLVWLRRWRELGVSIALTLAANAIWWLPSVLVGVSGDPAGASAFAARADSPWGLVGSLVSGGGMWNVASWPRERASLAIAGLWLVVVLAAIVCAWRRRPISPQGRALWASGAVGLLLALASGWSVTQPAWSSLLEALPGGGLLRDSQKLLAPWLLVVALSLGRAVDRLARHLGAWAIVGWGVAFLPVALMPSLALGAGGRLDAVPVPSGLRTAATVLSSAPEGEVGLLPWNQYRRYAWNDNRISLSIAPRMVGQRVLHDDSLPLRGGRVAGESPRATAVSARIAGGAAPVNALREQGVRYLLIERRTGLAEPVVPAGARVMVRNADAIVLEVNRDAAPPAAPEARTARWTGAMLTLATWVALLGAAGWARFRRRSGESVSPSSYGRV